MSSINATEHTEPQQAKPQRTTGLFVYRCHIKTTGQEMKCVIDTFLGGDAVRRVDFVIRKDKKTGKSFRTAFIHFNQWPDTDVSRQAEVDVLSGKPVDIVYSGTRFWRVNLNKMPEPRDLRTKSIFMPRINADTTEEQIKDVFATAFHGPDAEGRTSHITRINMVPKTDKNGNPYLAAYVHFSEWDMTESAQYFFGDAANDGGATLQWGDGNRDTWLCLLNRNTMGSGTTIDKRAEEAANAKTTKKGPYIAVSDIRDSPATPDSVPSLASIIPPVLRRQVAIRGCNVEGAVGENSLAPRNLIDELNAVETSKRMGISNIPAWMEEQRRAEERVFEDGECVGVGVGEEMV
jgi:hypothetical protein